MVVVMYSSNAAVPE